MRVTAAIVLMFSVLQASLAQAQTYDPAYPVCLQAYGITGNYISCSYRSMGQCKVAASARSAQCIANPYFGKRRR